MALYLAQHAKSMDKASDPGQGLAPEGIAAARRIARVAADYGVRVAAIRHSGKLRALQTAEIFAEALQPAGEVAETAGLKPLDDVRALAADLNPKDDLMLVGHLPFMERLTGWMIAGSADCRVVRFQNAGLVCLDQDPDSPAWYLKWALMPHID